MKTVLVGLDAFDPIIFERLSAAGRLPHLSQFVTNNQYSRFTVTNPPQSEVSWTSIATGLNPGGHGMFDFVHRNPATMGLSVSLLPMKKGIAGMQFTRPYTAKTIFDQAIDDGYPASALWWPATFPAKMQSPVQSIPGLGTPDILGQLGVGTMMAAEKPPSLDKLRFAPLNKTGKKYTGDLPGPLRKRKNELVSATLPVSIEIDDNTAYVTVGKEKITVPVGEWSDIFTVSFKLRTLFSMKAITRIIVNTNPVRLYFLPLQIHPLKTVWHYAAPPRFIRSVWNESPFLTLGWPQDTLGLEEGAITADQFLALCRDIIRQREAIFMRQIAQFEEGVLACVFDTLDRIQHVCLHQRPEVVEQFYEMFDGMVGRIQAAVSTKSDQLLIVSDHGFAPFDTKIHLNRWLIENGYLRGNGGKFSDVEGGQAYAVGLNSLYINLYGREKNGEVAPIDIAAISAELSEKLLDWKIDGKQVINAVHQRDDVFEGTLIDHAPDLVVGYAPGFRASAETGLGNWGDTAHEPNNDVWHADHCMDGAAVPGVIFASRDLANHPNPSYRDIPALTIGKNPDGSAVRPPVISDEDEETLRKRLEGLGYL